MKPALFLYARCHWYWNDVYKHVFPVHVISLQKTRKIRERRIPNDKYANI
jgi:hypothetical protein